MSFSKSIFTSKLNTLQDTQDSIVSISTWVFFHHRHAAEIASIWAEYTFSQPATRVLALLHLCNDVVQRARRKKRTEFTTEFARVLPDVFGRTYATLDTSTKSKVERLIKVWQERQVFDGPKIDEMMKAIKDGVVSTNTPSAVVPSIAPELVHLNELLLSLKKMSDSSQASLTQFGIQAKTYLPSDPDKSVALPSPNIYLSKLNMVEKLGKVAILSIKDMQSVKGQVLSSLQSLQQSFNTNTDETKVQIIEDKLAKLEDVRKDLLEMKTQNEEASLDAKKESHKEIQKMEKIEEQRESDEDVPTYEDSDQEDDFKNGNNANAKSNDIKNDENIHADQSNQISNNNSVNINSSKSGQNTSSLKRASDSPGPATKRVAFSEDVQVKEYEAEETEGTTGNAEFPHLHDGYEPKVLNSDVMSLLEKLA